MRDGNEESVHDARVATRRLRELVPLLASAHPERVAALTAILRRAGRRLGRVRELDVMRAHLARLQDEVPDAAAAAAVARRSLAEPQARARRRMIKALERMKLDKVDPRDVAPKRRLAAVRNRTRAFADWSGPLRERIGRRAEALEKAVERLGGVYLPNRAHATRIAVKKLRYSVELADRTGLWQPPRLLRDLRRAQQVLGDLHDAQLLLDRVDELVPEDAVLPRDRVSLRSALQSQIAAGHAAYVAKRDRLPAIAAACERFVAPRPLLSLARLHLAG